MNDIKKETIILGKWSKEKIDSLLERSNRLLNLEERIAFICRNLLNTPYKKSTLIGDKNNKEIFVINLKGMDCFTFIDYVEAMRLSRSFEEFKENLKLVRYKGSISYKKRRHFFTDWAAHKKSFVIDVTKKIGTKIVVKTIKRLNLKEDKTLFLEGIPPKKRVIYYIPTENIKNILKNLKTGDYIGIYSEKNGLDVSHVGIYIREKNKDFLCHASLKKGKVVKERFLKYLEGKKGIIVLRPRKI